MIDPFGTFTIAAASSALAAVVVLLCGWLWRAPRPRLASAGCLLGAALALYVDCWLSGCRPHWPPLEESDRLLLLLMPALIGVELLAVFVRHSILIWPLRLLIAAAAARTLLHDTDYLADLSGPGTRKWPPIQTAWILGGLSAALAVVWGSLLLLARRSSGQPLALAVALACAGATLTTMLSGQLSAAAFGFPLTAAVTGAAVASMILSGRADLRGLLGLGVVGLFALLVIGHFFAQLSTEHAILLFFAPLLCWLPELPYARRAGPRLRGCGRLVLTAVPVTLALLLARQQFVRDAAQTMPSSAPEPSIDDYRNYGK
jgi:hypothetical protein